MTSEMISALVAEGNKSYALRAYEEAVEKYAAACEQQSEETGEEDANLLYLYGRALFKVAVTQSEVLGEKTASERQTPVAEAKSDKSKLFQFSGEADDAEAEDEAEGGEEDAAEGGEKEDGEESKEPNEADEEEQSDFEVAWEILDLCRNLLVDQVEELEKDEAGAEELKEARTKLSDTFDILGEISLESENFAQAVEDLEESLKLREKLYPAESSLLSEAHYKLSLAYEFKPDDAEARGKAVEHMKLAIDSVKLRVAASGGEDKELIADLENRLQELEQADDEVDKAKNDAIEGILGESSGDLKSQLLNALGGANDISGLVRKRPAKDAESSKKASEPSKRAKQDS